MPFRRFVVANAVCERRIFFVARSGREAQDFGNLLSLVHNLHVVVLTFHDVHAVIKLSRRGVVGVHLQRVARTAMS